MGGNYGLVGKDIHSWHSRRMECPRSEWENAAVYYALDLSVAWLPGPVCSAIDWMTGGTYEQDDHNSHPAFPGKLTCESKSTREDLM